MERSSPSLPIVAGGLLIAGKKLQGMILLLLQKILEMEPGKTVVSAMKVPRKFS